MIELLAPMAPQTLKAFTGHGRNSVRLWFPLDQTTSWSPSKLNGQIQPTLALWVES